MLAHKVDGARCTKRLHQTARGLATRESENFGQSQERTSEAQIPQSTLIPLQMVVDAESLIIFVERPEFSQEWEVLSRILVHNLVTKIDFRYDGME